MVEMYESLTQRLDKAITTVDRHVIASAHIGQTYDYESANLRQLLVEVRTELNKLKPPE